MCLPPLCAIPVGLSSEHRKAQLQSRIWYVPGIDDV